MSRKHDKGGARGRRQRQDLKPIADELGLDVSLTAPPTSIGQALKQELLRMLDVLESERAPLIAESLETAVTLVRDRIDAIDEIFDDNVQPFEWN